MSAILRLVRTMVLAAEPSWLRMRGNMYVHAFMVWKDAYALYGYIGDWARVDHCKLRGHVVPEPLTMPTAMICVPVRSHVQNNKTKAYAP